MQHIFTVGENQYTTWDVFEGSIVSTVISALGTPFVLATVITSNLDDVSESDLASITANLSTDDVWNGKFLEIVILKRKSAIVVKSNKLNKLEHVTTSDTESLPDGPYLINTVSGKISSVARLFEDPLHAFVGGGLTYDASTQKFRLLQSTRYAVPSRLYYEANPTEPLRGLRFAVKDVIDIAGLKTSNGSRCWSDVYPPAENSAPFVQQLIDAGAILVGKLNCTQFCDGQDPSQRFEFVSPFNPRGDGYQIPSSSSSGSAVAAAGYDWVDFTVGTDTGGSIRHPAGVNGTYGIRPTLNSVNSRGMLASSFMDTLGVFARSAAMLDVAQTGITSQSQNFKAPSGPGARYKLLYPVRSKEAKSYDYPKWFSRTDQSSRDPEISTELKTLAFEYSKADPIFESVVAKLEKHLNCQRQVFNMDELWKTKHPENMDADLAKATGSIYQRLVYSATANDVVKPFIAKHKAARDGRTPYLEPIFKRRFEYGAAVSKEDFEEAVRGFATYKKWLLEVLFAGDPDEIVILLYPQSWGIPSYRDESTAPPENIFWGGFSLYSISYVSGCPDITVPVGQVPYKSRITEHEEWLPVSLSLLSQPGNDRMLGSLLKDLEETGVLRPVQTGSKTYLE